MRIPEPTDCCYFHVCRLVGDPVCPCECAHFFELAGEKITPTNSARDETVTYRKCCECAISCDRRSSGDCGYGYGV